jgi:hypothetical protein
VASLPTSTRLLHGLVSPEYLFVSHRLMLYRGLTQSSTQTDVPKPIRMLDLDVPQLAPTSLSSLMIP